MCTVYCPTKHTGISAKIKSYDKNHGASSLTRGLRPVTQSIHPSHNSSRRSKQRSRKTSRRAREQPKMARNMKVKMMEMMSAREGYQATGVHEVAIHLQPLHPRRHWQHSYTDCRWKTCCWTPPRFQDPFFPAAEASGLSWSAELEEEEEVSSHQVDSHLLSKSLSYRFSVFCFGDF